MPRQLSAGNGEATTDECHSCSTRFKTNDVDTCCSRPFSPQRNSRDFRFAHKWANKLVYSTLKCRTMFMFSHLTSSQPKTLYKYVRPCADVLAISSHSSVLWLFIIIIIILTGDGRLASLGWTQDEATTQSHFSFCITFASGDSGRNILLCASSARREKIYRWRRRWLVAASGIFSLLFVPLFCILHSPLCLGVYFDVLNGRRERLPWEFSIFSHFPFGWRLESVFFYANSLRRLSFFVHDFWARSPQGDFFVCL